MTSLGHGFTVKKQVYSSAQTKPAGRRRFSSSSSSDTTTSSASSASYSSALFGAGRGTSDNSSGSRNRVNTTRRPNQGRVSASSSLSSATSRRSSLNSKYNNNNNNTVHNRTVSRSRNSSSSSSSSNINSGSNSNRGDINSRRWDNSSSGWNSSSNNSSTHNSPSKSVLGSETKRRSSGVGRKASRSKANTTKTLSSQRFNKKTGDPFASTSNKKNAPSTAFAAAYKDGRIPCRINHGSVRHTLHWDLPLERLSYSPLLVLIAEGLSENIHPFVFVTAAAFKEALEAPMAFEKTVPITQQLIPPLRKALSSANTTTFLRALTATTQLSHLLREYLNPYLSDLLVQIKRKIFKKELKEVIGECLHTLGMNGGGDAVAMIKSKVPTFQICL